MFQPNNHNPSTSSKSSALFSEKNNNIKLKSNLTKNSTTTSSKNWAETHAKFEFEIKTESGNNKSTSCSYEINNKAQRRETSSRRSKANETSIYDNNNEIYGKISENRDVLSRVQNTKQIIKNKEDEIKTQAKYEVKQKSEQFQGTDLYRHEKNLKNLNYLNLKQISPSQVDKSKNPESKLSDSIEGFKKIQTTETLVKKAETTTNGKYLSHIENEEIIEEAHIDEENRKGKLSSELVEVLNKQVQKTVLVDDDYLPCQSQDNLPTKSGINYKIRQSIHSQEKNQDHQKSSAQNQINNISLAESNGTCNSSKKNLNSKANKDDCDYGNTRKRSFIKDKHQDTCFSKSNFKSDDLEIEESNFSSNKNNKESVRVYNQKRQVEEENIIKRKPEAEKIRLHVIADKVINGQNTISNLKIPKDQAGKTGKEETSTTSQWLGKSTIQKYRNRKKSYNFERSCTERSKSEDHWIWN